MGDVDERAMKERTKQFGLRVLRLVDELPGSQVNRRLGDQLIRCGTSVGANYRAACRGRSRAEFLSKLGDVEEEADETCYWLELLIDRAAVKPHRIEPLLAEALEITAIMVSSRLTTAQNSAEMARDASPAGSEPRRPNQKSQIKNRK